MQKEKLTIWNGDKVGNRLLVPVYKQTDIPEAICPYKARLHACM